MPQTLVALPTQLSPGGAAPGAWHPLVPQLRGQGGRAELEAEFTPLPAHCPDWQEQKGGHKARVAAHRRLPGPGPAALPFPTAPRCECSQGVPCSLPLGFSRWGGGNPGAGTTALAPLEGMSLAGGVWCRLVCPPPI